MDYTKLNQTLKINGQRSTKARQAIYDALRDKEPLTMHELVERCTIVDRASVYRNVALFEQFGIIQRLQNGWKYKLELAGGYHEHHHHATCLICGQSLVLPENKVLEQYLKRTAKALSFQLERHQLELQGYCATCTESYKPQVRPI